MKKNKFYGLLIIVIIILFFIPSFVRAATIATYSSGDFNIQLVGVKSRDEVDEKMKSISRNYTKVDEERAVINVYMSTEDGYCYMGEADNRISIPAEMFLVQALEECGGGAYMYVEFVKKPETVGGDQTIDIVQITEDDGNYDPNRDNLAQNRPLKGISDAISAYNKFKKWSKGLGEHPIENLIIDSQNAVLSFFDGIQIFINNIQTQVDYTAQDEKMLYSYTELDEDGKGKDISDVSTDETKKAIGNRDKYTKVGEYTENDKSVTYINVSNPDYTGSTKIPVMVADFCNVATGKIDFLDINFFTGDKTKKKIKLEGKTKKVLKHGKETVWYMVNNIVKIIIRIVIYLAAVILITILIWHGLHTVGRGASGTPISMKEHKEALNRFALSLLMLVSSVVVMAICIFGTQEFFRLMKVDESNELPVRINVEGAYSFSTTPTGYIRYMASTDNWQNCTSKVGYTFGYCIMTLLNVVVVAFMGARIFLMWFVSILGPIFAALSAINEQGINRYRSWVVLYLSLSAVPVIMCLLNRIMINAI